MDQQSTEIQKKMNKTKVENKTMYPNMIINVTDRVIDFHTHCLVFEAKPDGSFDAYITPVRYRFKGELEQVDYKAKVIIDSVMNNGKPLKDNLFSGKDEILMDTPFYKNMTKDEIQNHFNQCQILYRGNTPV